MVKSFNTVDEFTANLPKLTSNPLPIKPPFVFNGMSARVFPLRAHLGMLQRLCDGYMNFVPPQVGYFRAPLPYVYVLVLDYGQIAEAVARIGWFAQTEVFFMIPLEWYKLVNGKWTFHDWAVITPYVFVNDEFSVPLGRTVYGFPKVLAKVTAVPSGWVENATAPVTLARIETAVFPETYSGSEIENRVFLEVERSTVTNLRVPFDASSPVFPWSIASHLAEAMAGFGRDAMWLAQAMRFSPVNPGSDPGVAQAMLARMAPWFAPGGKGFVQNSINLKQFRRSNEPSQICYQALTNGCMEVKAFNGAGLLGEYPILLGDLSGGYTVRLYEYASLPLIRTLGLAVDRQWQGPDCTVAELKPVLPCWLDVDIKYDQGNNLAWRTDDRSWRDGTGVPFDVQPAAAPANAPAFNQAITTAVDDIAGPFEFSDSTVRILPLLAERTRLQSFIDHYINAPFSQPIPCKNGNEEQIRFTVWGQPGKTAVPEELAIRNRAYVYLAVSSFGSVLSTTNNIGDWTKYQLSFMIPVQFERCNAQGGWELVGVGLVPAFSFVDNCIAAIARLEVQGFEATVANFFKPESVWLSDEVDLSDNPPQTLLRVDTEVWPAIGEGQKAVVQPIIEIRQGEPGAGLGDAPDAPWRWAEELYAELQAKKQAKADRPKAMKIARALALELLGNQMPFVAYSLKQFRDARDPERACYQSLVRVPREIRELVDLREIEETLVVHIHNYPSLDIVNQLGLIATQQPVSGTGVVSTVQAIRPFFLRGTLYEPLAERLAFRAGADDWDLDAHALFSTLLSDEAGAPPITTDYLAEKLQDQVDPCRIAAIMYQAALRQKAASGQPDSAKAAKDAQEEPIRFSKADACQALSQIEPQAVIESILSREWGNADERARWRVGRAELIKTFSALPLSGNASAFAESVLYRRINNDLALAPGSVASVVQVKDTYQADEDLDKAIRELETWKPKTPGERWKQTIQTIILSQEKFMRWRLKMENTLGLLAAAAIFSPQGIKEIYSQMKEKPPTDGQLLDLCGTLISALDTIGGFKIVGEPSEHNNLDARVAADRQRLQEVLTQLGKEFKDELSIDLKLNEPISRQSPENSRDISPELLQWVFDHTDQFQQLVNLAREFCDAQNEAFRNKLSRAYQKPDFCIRRDSVPGYELLPLSLSWNAEWFYGPAPSSTSRPKARESSAPGAVKGNGVAKSGGKGAKV